MRKLFAIAPSGFAPSAFLARAAAASALAVCALGPPAPARASSAAANTEAPGGADARRPVLVAPIKFASEGESHALVATIRPRIEVDQGFRVAGKVARRLVDVGAHVKAGDPLAILDEHDLRLQKEAADAELAAAARALQTAEADEERGRVLVDKGWNSAAAYDRQKSTLAEARSRRDRAVRNVELANNSLGYATLRSDSDGDVTAVLTEPGQVMAAGQSAVRIARGGELEAQAAVPENMIGALRAARPARGRLALWSSPGKSYNLRLREIGPSADAASRTYPARFTIENPDAAIAMGMSATVRLDLPGAGRVARAPLSALYNQGAGPGLWTVTDDGVLTLKPVTVLRYEGQEALIGGGVADGEKIVILGVQKLDPAVRVRPVDKIAF